MALSVPVSLSLYMIWTNPPHRHTLPLIPRWISNHMSSRMWSGPRFTNGFSIAIQIRWKFRLTLNSILIQWSLQNCVHGTTAVLSWHVQKFVVICWPATELWQGQVFIEFELRGKKLVKRVSVRSRQVPEIWVWSCPNPLNFLGGLTPVLLRYQQNCLSHNHKTPYDPIPRNL